MIKTRGAHALRFLILKALFDKVFITGIIKSEVPFTLFRPGGHMFKRLVVLALYALVATTFVACATPGSDGSGGCVSSVTSPSCGGGTTPPSVMYDTVNPPVWHRFVREDGSQDPYFEVALLEEPIPARGKPFFVQGCQNPCISLHLAVRMTEMPGQPLFNAGIGVKTSIDGVNPADGALGSFSVANGQTVEYNTRGGAITWFVANSYKWVLLQTTYTDFASGRTRYTATGRLFMDYGPRQ